MKKYAKRVDSNHSKIRDRIREIPGFMALDTSKVGEDFPDIMVGGRLFGSNMPRCVLVEIKSKTGKLTEGQKEFAEIWGVYIPVIEARFVSDVLRVFGWPEGMAKDLD